MLKLSWIRNEGQCPGEAGQSRAPAAGLRGVLRGLLLAALLGGGTLSLAACSSTGEVGAQGGGADRLADGYRAQDPLEPMNRAVFKLNQGIDFWLLKPAATVYKDALPDGVQHAVDNLLTNLNQPLYFANSILQGDIDNAGRAMGKFAANSFMGFGGVMDVVPDIEVREADFGETLAVWGIGSGPYLVLPLIGPSTFRDGVGIAVDSLADPFTRVAVANDALGLAIARTAVAAVNARSQALGVLDELEATSVDFYAAMRSLYLQRRAAEIRAAKGEAGPSEDNLPAFD